jgi:Bax protein
MLKVSKTHSLLISTLGIMMISQLGLVLYKDSPLRSILPGATEKMLLQGGTAKAFGMVIPKEKHFQVSSTKELDHVFNKCNYTLTKATSEGKVPPLYLAKLPNDMVKKAKSTNPTFVQVLLPHILKVNAQISEDRKRLLELKEQQKTRHLRHTEKMWLMKLASDYRCKSTKIDALLVHVDIIPPSLALAQAIIETGGGRSSAARKKNSTFGYMKTKTQVATFKDLFQNVQAYATNLNRHEAYGAFRKVRAELRAKNQPLCGIKLASCLDKYSIRRGAYIREVQGQIPKLRKYDSMTLDQQIRLKP